MKLNQWFITALAYLSTCAYALEAQIVDTNGYGIANALIEAVGESLSTTSDTQGRFKLDIDSGTELHISAPGYAHKILEVETSDLNSLATIVLRKSVIEQIDVIGSPVHLSNIESAIPINVLSGESLREKQAASLGDTLSNEVGIHSSFHGNVASTPVIRGLSGPRVLVTQNSLDVSDVSRIGSDHSVSSEVATAQRIEVLRGPATLFYGSGAIGGVVNVVDNRVPTDTEGPGELLLSHDTVNDQKLLAYNINAGAGNLALHLDGFWRNSNDYEVPVSPELEEHHDDEDEDHDEEAHGRKVESTAEESNGFTFGTSYLLDNGYVGVSFGRLERDYGIPGHSHGEEEHEEEEVTLGLEQDRYQMISKLYFDENFINTVKARFGYTDYTHTEFENAEVGTTFTNETYELKLELLHQPFSHWHGGLVIDYKTSDFSAQGDEAFAPPSTTDTFAVALLEERHFGDVLVQLGTRVEHVNIDSNDVTIAEVEFHPAGEEYVEEGEEEEHEDEVFKFDESYTPFSVSLGAVWDFAEGYNMGVSISHAERAPSAAELLSFGPHIATGFFEIGAVFEQHEEDEEIHFEFINDKPEMEKSNNIDLSIRKFEGDIGFILNAFYNQVDNYYAEFDTELVAEAGHAHEEEEEHGEELPVIVFSAEDATLRGFEAQAVWQISSQFKTTLQADYVRAKLDNGGYLPRIPPLRYGLRFDYQAGQVSANVSWTHYDDQDDVAALESKTKGYDWVDANINYLVPFDEMDMSFFLRVENLTDEEARVHTSFLKNLAPRPGRNFRIGVRSTF